MKHTLVMLIKYRSIKNVFHINAGWWEGAENWTLIKCQIQILSGWYKCKIHESKYSGQNKMKHNVEYVVKILIWSLKNLEINWMSFPGFHLSLFCKLWKKARFCVQIILMQSTSQNIPSTPVLKQVLLRQGGYYCYLELWIITHTDNWALVSS